MQGQYSSSASALKRKYHKKSRAGCLNCKNRRIKCDEDYPICKSCHRRQEACVWGNKSRDPITTFLTPAASAAISIPHDHQLALPQVGLYQKRELELLHNWTTNTVLTFIPDSPRPRYGFQVMLPQLGFEHEFLLHSMFAVSALHMHTFRPSADEFLRLAKMHCQRAILGLHSAGDSASGTSLVMSNALLGIYWLASPSWSAIPGNGIAPDIFDWLPPTRIFMRSLGSYVLSLKNSTDPDLTLMPDDLSYIRKDFMATPFPSVLYNIHRADFCPFDLDELEDPKVVALYDHALLKLSQTWNVFMNPMMQNAAFFQFLSNPDQDFFELFMKKRSRALVIVAHFCAVMGQFDGTWLYGWERARSDIQRILFFLDEKWLFWMEYPLNIMAMKENPTFDFAFLDKDKVESQGQSIGSVIHPLDFESLLYPSLTDTYTIAPSRPNQEEHSFRQIEVPTITTTGTDARIVDFHTALQHTADHPNELSTFGPPII